MGREVAPVQKKKRATVAAGMVWLHKATCQRRGAHVQAKYLQEALDLTETFHQRRDTHRGGPEVTLMERSSSSCGWKVTRMRRNWRVER